jgi:hypothetical protein
MQEHIDDWSTASDRPFYKRLRTRPMFLRFLLGTLGSVMLIAAAAAAIVPKLTGNQLPIYANASQSTTHGHVTLQLDTNLHILAVQARIFGAPPNTPLAMDILSGSNTGSPLFHLQATSNDKGSAFTAMIFSDQQDSTIASNWFFNVYDTTRQAFNGDSLSIARGTIQVDSTGLTGSAQLHPVQQEGLNLTTQSMTQGLATLQLNPAAHTLAVQAFIFGAPSDTPLVMHIHGSGSCTGPILFMLQATTDSQGHAFVSMTFDDQQDSVVPSNWFFNVHDTTRQETDGKPLSIACGPIQTIDPMIAFAKLAPVQPDPIQLTPTSTPNPTTTTPTSTLNPTTTTLSTTEGLTTFLLDPNTHILTIQVNIFGAPPNAPLTMNIRHDSCTGPTIPFPMHATSDSIGNASLTMTVNDAQDTTIPMNLFFSVDNTSNQGLNGQSLSIACAPIEVADPSDQIAYALLCPVQFTPLTPSSTTPTATATSTSTVTAEQSTTQGLAVLFLNAAKHTLNVLAHLVGAPPNTPLGLDIRGGGSCTGPTLFMIPTTSNAIGSINAIMPFKDIKDPKLSQNLFFSVYGQGPNGHVLPIACGPILTAGQIGLVQLSPQ